MTKLRVSLKKKDVEPSQLKDAMDKVEKYLKARIPSVVIKGRDENNKFIDFECKAFPSELRIEMSKYLAYEMGLEYLLVNNSLLSFK